MSTSLYRGLTEKKAKLAVIGLGYVGLPLLYEFSLHFDVIGYDHDSAKVQAYKQGFDVTGEIGNEAMSTLCTKVTDDESGLDGAAFWVITVQTPVSSDNLPDLTPLRNASSFVGRHLKTGDIVVYESTVYPGVTENVCKRELENASGLLSGKDFHLGYSPERINPADKRHRLNNVVKIVSGDDAETLDTVEKIYGKIVKAGVHRVSSIRAAEAVKLAENCQRDVNIAFMNELAVLLDKLGISVNEVVDAMRTKWNSLDFRPGLVGGHCIAVDPYYLIHLEQLCGLPPGLIQAARNQNDSMSDYIIDRLCRGLNDNKIDIDGAVVTILGFTFKENCPDIRNTMVEKIAAGLAGNGLLVQIVDPVADPGEVQSEYGLSILEEDKLLPADAVLIAVAHDEFLSLDSKKLISFFKPGLPYMFVGDVKGILDPKRFEGTKICLWQL